MDGGQWQLASTFKQIDHAPRTMPCEVMPCDAIPCDAAPMRWKLVLKTLKVDLNPSLEKQETQQKEETHIKEMGKVFNRKIAFKVRNIPVIK